jgi:hypothetical protein
MAERTPRFLPSPGSLWGNRAWLRWLVLDALADAENPAAILDLIRAEVAREAPENLHLVPQLDPEAPLPARRPPKPMPWWLLFDRSPPDG